MSESKQNIKQRKEQLEAEITQLQNKLESSVVELKSDALKHVNPRYIIQEYPKTSLGIAAILGYLIAGRRKPEKMYQNGNESYSESVKIQPTFKEPGFTSLVFMELKRVLMQKGTTIAMRYIEDFVEQKMGSRDKQKKD